jgi:hypothetical protein
MYIAKITTPKLTSIMHTATISKKHETASDEQLHRSSTTLKLRKLRLHRIRTDTLLISKLLPLQSDEIDRADRVWLGEADPLVEQPRLRETW